MIRRTSLALTLLIAACGGGGSGPTTPPPPPTTTVDHVTVDPTAATVVVGTTRQLQATAFATGGAAINGAEFTYASSATAVATVSSIGTITGVTPGTATITTTSGGKNATTAVTVELAPVGNITLTLDRTLIKESDTVTAIAVVRDEQNKVIQRDLTWTTSDPTLAIVTPTGLILGLKAGGPVTITASYGNKSASVVLAVIFSNVATVQLTPQIVEVLPGGTKTITASVIDEFGYPVVNRPVVWASFNPAAATVDQNGVITAVAIGESTISATVGGVTGQALVRVTTVAEERFRIEVTNNLNVPVEILQNGVVLVTTPANGSAAIERPLTASLTLSWRSVPPLGRGETFGESLAPIANPTGAVPLVIDNVLNDGRVYFNPVLRNLTGKKARADFPVRDNASPCQCSITTNDNNQPRYGYWLLTSNSVMRVYGELDEQLAGPFLTFPVTLGALDPLTGAWRFNLLTTP